MLLVALPALAQDASVIPGKRLIIQQNTDLPGGDIASLFDITGEACEAACHNDPACRAITYNEGTSACFPKSDPGPPVPYQRAYSAYVQTKAPEDLIRARARAEAAPFLDQAGIEEVRALAQGLPHAHTTDFGVSPADLRRMATEARKAGNPDRALQLAGAALVLTDTADDWLAYATLIGAQSGPGEGRRLFRTALAALNGYLRAVSDETAARTLVAYANAMALLGEGQQGLRAMNLAADLDPRPAVKTRRDTFAVRYGFHIKEQIVESDPAEPRVCAVFSEPLDDGAFD